jgi:thioredoxin reductase (NADPH)
VDVDDKGFVLTGEDAKAGGRLFETSVSGIFAIGDVRAGSIKRVAAGVGEGAQVAAALHAYLASDSARRAPSESALRREA